MSEKRLKQEIESYKDEIRQLEQYLIDCVNVFAEYSKHLTDGGGEAPDSLKGLIAHVLASTLAVGSYAEGVYMAYKDCIDMLSEIADDTEEHLPDNKKALQLATAYRTLAEGIQDKMVIFGTPLQGKN